MRRFLKYLGAKLIPALGGAGGSRRAREATAVTTSLTTGSETKTINVSFTESERDG